MSTATNHASDYIMNTQPDMRERIKLDVSNLDLTTKALIASYRGILHDAIGWISRFEDFGDSSALRAMHQAAFKVGGAKTMLDAYMAAQEQELPASVVQEYGDFEGLYEGAKSVADLRASLLQRHVEGQS